MSVSTTTVCRSSIAAPRAGQPGVRLAALSLAGHPDPRRFVAEFSGNERTVADYLLDEVLARQPAEVRRLLLRTSILDNVTGPLADHLLGSTGSERVLLSLEDENTLVVAVDAARTTFRYHHLLADLLRLELRRTSPEDVAQLHLAAAEWYVAHGNVLEAVRHAVRSEAWDYAGRLLAEHGLTLSLDGQGAAVDGLLAALPADARREARARGVHRLPGALYPFARNGGVVHRAGGAAWRGRPARPAGTFRAQPRHRPARPRSSSRRRRVRARRGPHAPRAGSQHLRWDAPRGRRARGGLDEPRHRRAVDASP